MKNQNINEEYIIEVKNINKNFSGLGNEKGINNDWCKSRMANYHHRNNSNYFYCF